MVPWRSLEDGGPDPRLFDFSGRHASIFSSAGDEGHQHQPEEHLEEGEDVEKKKNTSKKGTQEGPVPGVCVCVCVLVLFVFVCFCCFCLFWYWGGGALFSPCGSFLRETESMKPESAV